MNPAVAFTLILLSLMIGTGVVSASWGYTLGRQALTGVRQPESRPTSGAPITPSAPSPGSPAFASEDAIIQEVKLRLDGGLGQ